MIAGIGVPPGVSNGDVETLGHAYVLIPEADSSQAAPTITALNGIQITSSASDMKRATAELIQRMRNHRVERRTVHAGSPKKRRRTPYDWQSFDPAQFRKWYTTPIGGRSNATRT